MIAEKLAAPAPARLTAPAGIPFGGCWRGAAENAWAARACDGSEGAGRVDAEQFLRRGILGRLLTAEGIAWCVWGLSLVLAVVGAARCLCRTCCWSRGLPRSGWWWPCGGRTIGSAGCSWAWGWSRR